MTPVLTTSNVIDAAGTVERSIIRNLEDIKLTASPCVAEARGMASTDIICNNMSWDVGLLGNLLPLGKTKCYWKCYLISGSETLQVRFGASFDGRDEVA